MSPLGLPRSDSYLLMGGAFGLYALDRLSPFQEEGQIERRDMIGHILGGAGRVARNLGKAAGLRGVTDLSGSLLRDARLLAGWMGRQRSAALGKS